jgi:hypothetical protein
MKTDKRIVAFLAAGLMTVCVLASMFAVGGVALLNRAGVVPADAAGASSATANASFGPQASLPQLQSQIAQYQSREREYQTREQQLQAALRQAQSQAQVADRQMQQVEQLLLALQQRGLITILNDGSIVINR